MLRYIALISLTFLGALAPCGAQTSSVPLSRGPGGTMTVPVSINGQPARRFIFDLGAGVTVVAPSGAQGTPVGNLTAWRMTGQRLDTQLYRVSSLTVGPLTQNDDFVAQWGGVTAAGVDGMLSAREFAATPFTVDFSSRQLVFEDRESLRAREDAGFPVPLAIQDDRGKSLSLFADLDFGNGQRGECLIDTGQFNIQINKRYMDALGVRTTDAGVVTQDDHIIAHLPAIALAGAPRMRAEHPKVIFRDLIYDCVIGNSFWVPDAIVTFDIAARHMYVRRKQ